jgi:hypothetical protein
MVAGIIDGITRRRRRDELRWRDLTGKQARDGRAAARESHNGRYWVMGESGLYEAYAWERWEWYDGRWQWVSESRLCQDADMEVCLRMCEWHHRATNAPFPDDALLLERPAKEWVDRLKLQRC